MRLGMQIKDSQWKVKTWKGFNLHVLSTDGEIPLACVLIGASVHYSQSAPAYEGADKMRIIVRPGHVGVLMPSGLVFVSEKGVIVQIYGEPLDRAIREREDKKKFSMWDWRTLNTTILDFQNPRRYTLTKGEVRTGSGSLPSFWSHGSEKTPDFDTP